MGLTLTHRHVRLRNAEPFRISRETIVDVDAIEVTIAHDGVSGHGEAVPTGYYGETVASSTAFLDAAATLLGDDPFALERVGDALAELPRDQAAKAAVDAALHDLCGKLAGLPAWRLLGLQKPSVPTTYTIWLGDPDDMAARARAATGDRYRRLKLKLGGGDGLDVERVRAVRAATPLPLIADVNEHWSLDEALDALPELARLGLECLEQPLRAGDPDGPRLKARSPIPVYVDEDCHTSADVPFCAERAHGVNLKLLKSGGIREAIRIVHTARALGLGVMIGCMEETSLGIAAACAVAGLCDHVDLDGNLLLARDPWRGIELVDGVQLPSDRPGLGVERRE